VNVSNDARPDDHRLYDLVLAELTEPVASRVTTMAAAIAGLYPGSRAVLFYGSCLREAQLDGLMLDFYLIVADYDRAFGRSWLVTANRLIPPNVFPYAHDGLAAKYAVLSEADFAALNRAEASTVSVWARFAQPTRLVWAADEAASQAVVVAISQAAPTLLSLAGPMNRSPDPLDVWRTGFALTYGCELRAERHHRPGSIVDAEPQRYLRFAAAISVEPATNAARRWGQLRRKGKGMTIVRLAKASLTFAGGIDYLAWKINRHAGTQIIVKPWQRRWPLIGALVLVPRLMRQGAIR
jgi:hypothetical protein